MHHFRLLGGVGLVDGGGREVEALLRQPKHIALLAYLALPAPGTWHRRDTILATFWPELEQSRARAALRSALYTVRRHLPDGAIGSRGDDELSVDPALLDTDVAQMVRDFATGEHASALRRYRGELLPGMYIADAPDFEQWLDARRRQVRDVARKSAAHLAEQRTAQGDLAGATEAARRATELDPDDELAARRLIALLDRAGDRAGAFAVYEQFRIHMAEEFGAPPSAETIALIDAVRMRRMATVSPVVADAAGSVDTASEARAAAPDAGIAPLPAPRDQRPSTSKSRMQWLWAAAPLALGALGWMMLHPQSEAASAPATRSLFVLPMVNETGDPSLAYIATGIAEDLAKRLDDIGGLDVRSGARSATADVSGKDVRAAGRFAPTDFLRSSMTRVGDSLEVHAVIVDAATMSERALRVHGFSAASINDVESRLAADVAGSVFRVAVPAVPRRGKREVDPESYRLMLEGWHQLLSNVEPTAPGQPTGRNLAGALFQRAVNIDPLNARAWSGLSSVSAYQANTDEIPFDEGYERVSAAALHALELDSLEGSAWANLAFVRSMKFRDLDMGQELLRKAEAAEPSNPEIFMIKQVILASAWKYEEARDAARFARQLDPLGLTYLNHEASSELCLDRPEAAVELFEAELTVNPSVRLARVGLTRALARAGRYDDAIASWMVTARAARDTSLITALAGARGRDGYWRVRHAEGRKRLAALARQTGRVPPLRLVQASFASGDTVAALAAVERALEAGTPGLTRLSCMVDLDEYRGTPMLARTMDRIGPIRSQK